MFEPVSMSRASIVILERDERTVLRLLGWLGVLQLTHTPAGPDNAPLPPPDRRRELAQCDRLAARVQEIRRSLEMESDGKPAAATLELSLSQAEEKIAGLEKTAGGFLKNRQQLARRAGELKVIGGQLSDYRGLGIPLDQPDESSFLHFVTGSLPPENLEKLQSEISGNVALLPLPAQKARQPLMAMTTRHAWPALESALRQAGFQAEALPVASGETVDTVSDENRREREQLAAGLERLDARRRRLAEKFAPSLAEIEFAAETERRLLEAGQNFSRTESAVLLAGWIPSADATGLKNHLREITNGRCVMTIAGPSNSSDEEIPVLLRHPRWLRPFEMLVTAYGLPQYCELEPTLFVAVSYVLMFGMMFGDVGHGAVLALGGLAALFAGRTAQIRGTGRLLLFAGGSSMMFGALYGSCFGIEAFKKFALWHDPLAGDPMSLMTGAIGIGITMISLGLVLNIINRFRRGDFIGGFLGKFGVAGAVFYWGALALAANYAAVKAQGLVMPAIIVFLALPILGWTLKEPLELIFRRRAGKSVEPDGSVAGAFTESLVGAFEGVLGYFANTISFVRLAAYAMSHAALLLAAFLMADAVKHLPVAGTFLSVLVIILGNAVAITLEGIVASVQALRLEYYEFFGKFFSGGGQPFKPFRLQTKTVAEAPL
ncbi:MAG: V-type ATPase 116kDa subunit family protein [Verrucomicrobiales bacterium]|nr:V-type ATPase 116kDa subunit family protein [Verrucomicrobiales bacterium]